MPMMFPIKKHISRRNLKLQSEVSNNLRTILNELNMNQLEFAQSVGISNVYISMIINGKRNSISQPLALLIEEKYGYSAGWLLYNEGEKKIFPFKAENTSKELRNEIRQLSLYKMNCLVEFILWLEKKEKYEEEKRKLRKQCHSFI
jgi:transcriptional regulator with XRE-family HTH domain